MTINNYKTIINNTKDSKNNIEVDSNIIDRHHKLVISKIYFLTKLKNSHFLIKFNYKAN